MGCRSVAFTYNDPIVWAEYVIDTAAACRRLGVKTVAVTSGYITAEAREAFYENIDAANVDLKGFNDDFYRRLTGGRLEPVLDTLRWLARRNGTWLEITNLLIPGENDAPAEIERMCRWIAADLGLDVPLHFSAFHPAFELADHPPTPPATLAMAYDIARRCGLRYVYTGNINNRRRQSTYCPGCGQAAVERDGYALGGYHIRQGHCSRCGAAIAGCFDDAPGDWGGRRLPIRIGDVAPPRVEAPPPPAARPVLSDEQRRQVFRAAGRRVAAAVLGAAGPPLAAMLGDAAKTPVYGSFVSLKRGGQLRSCCGFLGHSSPLAEALGHAALRAAKDDPRFPPITAAELTSLDMEVWLLWGPEPVAAQGRQRLKAITIGRHGLLISRGPARGLLLPSVAVEHRLDALGFLQQVCLKAGLPSDAWMQDDVALMTFEGDSIRGRLQEAMAVEGREIAKPQADAAAKGDDALVSTCGFAARQQADAGGDRPAAVAGAFYPSGCEQIARTLDEFFAAESDAPPRPWPAAMVPHAGWIYSGRLAAAVLARIAIPTRVVILCPHHRPEGAAWAVAPWKRWLIPGGAVEADLELARRLADAVEGLQLDAEAHRAEHAIEVQLPLLAPPGPGGSHRRHRRRRRRFAGIAAIRPRVGGDDRERVPAAALADFQRHEPLRRRSRNPAAGPAGPGRHANPRSGPFLPDRPKAPHQHVRTGTGGDRHGSPAAVGPARTLRSRSATPPAPSGAATRKGSSATPECSWGKGRRTRRL